MGTETLNATLLIVTVLEWESVKTNTRHYDGIDDLQRAGTAEHKRYWVTIIELENTFAGTISRPLFGTGKARIRKTKAVPGCWTD